MENSKIQWCDHTFNPWMGCTKVSTGCKHCYAETMMDKRWGKVKWGPQGERVRTSPANWNKPLKWNDDHVDGQPRQRVFCGSLCDVFEDIHYLNHWRFDLFDLIERTPNLDWLLLTKRPENVMEMVPASWGVDQAGFPDNVWVGTSVENQETADVRIPSLLTIPAKVRFLSCEPLLSEVNIVDQPYWDWRYTYDYFQLAFGISTPPIDWVIVGGESGPGFRPMQTEWVKSLMKQCARAGIAFFMKQMANKKPIPTDLFIRDFPVSVRV